MKLVINVTQELIDKGNHYTHSCPVALALSAAFGVPVFVGWGHWGVADKGMINPLTPEMKEWITKFDKNGAVHPIQFSVEIP